jgi:hypothetical protein
MVAVGDDQFLVSHLLLNEPDGLGIRNNPDGVLYAILVIDLNIRFWRNFVSFLSICCSGSSYNIKICSN